jgi:hypothetical protein
MMINHEELDEMMGNRLSVEEGRELTSTGLEIIARIKELPDNPDMFLGAFCGIYANMQQLHCFYVHKSTLRVKLMLVR